MSTTPDRSYFTESDLYALAASTPSPTAQRILLASSNKQMPLNLAKNKNLHPELWDRLYDSGDYVAKAFLISNATTSEQADRILDSIQHAALPLKLGVPKMSVGAKEKLLASKQITAEHAAGLLLHGAVALSEAAALWKRVPDYRDVGHPTLEGISYPAVLTAMLLHYGHLVSNAELLVKIEHSPSILPSTIRAILDCRPSITPKLLKMDELPGSYTAVAGSRHITEEQALVLLDILRKDSGIFVEKCHASITLFANPSLPYSLRAEAASISIELDEQVLSSSRVAPPAHAVPTAIYEAFLRYSHLASIGAKHVTTPWHEVTKDQPWEISQIQESFRLLHVDSYPTMKHHHIVTDYQKFNYENITFSELFQVPTGELDAAGPAAWENYLALLPEWTFPIEDLAKVSISAAR